MSYIFSTVQLKMRILEESGESTTKRIAFFKRENWWFSADEIMNFSMQSRNAIQSITVWLWSPNWVKINAWWIHKVPGTTFAWSNSFLGTDIRGSGIAQRNSYVSKKVVAETIIINSLFWNVHFTILECSFHNYVNWIH